MIRSLYQCNKKYNFNIKDTISYENVSKTGLINTFLLIKSAVEQHLGLLEKKENGLLLVSKIKLSNLQAYTWREDL
jgi:hypothetical protein